MTARRLVPQFHYEIAELSVFMLLLIVAEVSVFYVLLTFAAFLLLILLCGEL